MSANSTNSTYYGPTGESSSDIFLERTFLSSDFLTGFGYGVQTALYFASASFLWQQRKSRKSSPWLLIYITVLFILNTIYAACTARDVQLDYIDDRNYPGGPLAYFFATTAIPVNVIAFVVFFIANVLADGLLVWRCYVIWSASGIIRIFVMIIPVLMLLASFSVGVVFTIQSSTPGSSLYSDTAVSFGLPYFVLSLSLNIILTILIIVRLLAHRRDINRIMGPEHGLDYTSLVALIVESAVLYSVFALAFLITYAINSSVNQVFIGLVTPAQLIASYLIIYRVAQGRAWSTDTLQNTGTAMKFHTYGNQTGMVSTQAATESSFPASTFVGTLGSTDRIHPLKHSPSDLSNTKEV